VNPSGVKVGGKIMISPRSVLRIVGVLPGVFGLMAGAMMVDLSVAQPATRTSETRTTGRNIERNIRTAPFMKMPATGIALTFVRSPKEACILRLSAALTPDASMSSMLSMTGGAFPLQCPVSRVVRTHEI